MEKLSLVRLLHHLDLIALEILFFLRGRCLLRSLVIGCTTDSPSDFISLGSVHLVDLLGRVKSAPGVSGMGWLWLLACKLLIHVRVSGLECCLLGPGYRILEQKVLIVKLLELRLT